MLNVLEVDQLDTIIQALYDFHTTLISKLLYGTVGVMDVTSRSALR